MTGVTIQQGGKSAELNQTRTNDTPSAKQTGKPQQQFISQYHKEMREWSKNVDKRYAWVILAALWFTFAATLGSYRIYGLVFAKVTTTGVYSREDATWPVSMIFTTENISGPLISIIAYYISYRNSMLIGGLLIICCNSLTYWSDSLLMDIILIGICQGFGYAFIFMPFMEVINSYFQKYRNIALGFSLCGGTMSVFVLTPIFQHILEHYHWRTAYLAVGMLTCINILMVPLLRPNPKPVPSRTREAPSRGMSFRALAYQSSLRRQSTILVRSNSCNRLRGSVISVNPFAATVGAERKISRPVAKSGSVGHSERHKDPALGATPSSECKHHLKTQSKEELINTCETKSLHDIEQETARSAFDMSIIWDILKTPGFHIIWYMELTYYWIFSIFCLVLVDFGLDRGCTREQAERLLLFQSIGEMLGRLGLTVLADMQFISCQNTVILNLLIMTSILCIIPFVEGFMWIATMTVLLNAFASLLYILINGLLVSKVGESKVTIGYGLASSVTGVLIIFRPQAVGFFRDYMGSYEWLMVSLGMACLFGATICLIEGLVARFCCKKHVVQQDSNQA